MEKRPMEDKQTQEELAEHEARKASAEKDWQTGMAIAKKNAGGARFEVTDQMRNEAELLQAQEKRRVEGRRKLFGR